MTIRPPGAGSVQLDASVRIVDGGRVLVGGSPLKVLSLSEQASEALARGDWTSPHGRALAARLIKAGVAHPHPSGGPGLAEVSVVIPVRDRTEQLSRLVAGLDPELEVIVVDDGSAEPVRGAAVRHDSARGPAAARNAGIARATRPFVALLDSDVVTPAGWLHALLPHFSDPRVAGVAPRIVTARGSAESRLQQVLARYDAARSPLDLGSQPGRVAPGSRLSYLPAAALVLRRAALGDGPQVFDESLRYGEDVDLIWRLAQAGWSIRYEPGSTVGHAHRSTLASAAAQRFGYGCSAAPLAERHPGQLAPFAGNRWTLASWGLLAAGHPGAAAATFAAAALKLSRKLPVEQPLPLAVRLVAGGWLTGGRALGEALTRPYGPVALPLLIAPGPGARARRLIAAAAVLGPAAREYRRKRPELDPLRWVLLRAGDDLAYGAGLWAGCARRRVWEPLRPRIT